MRVGTQDFTSNATVYHLLNKTVDVMGVHFCVLS